MKRTWIRGEGERSAGAGSRPREQPATRLCQPEAQRRSQIPCSCRGASSRAQCGCARARGRVKTRAFFAETREFAEEGPREGREPVARPQRLLSNSSDRLLETFLRSFSSLQNVLERRLNVCSKHLTSRPLSKIIYKCKINKPLPTKVLPPSYSRGSLVPLLPVQASHFPRCTRQPSWQPAPGNLLAPWPQHDASLLSPYVSGHPLADSLCTPRASSVRFTGLRPSLPSFI